VTNFSPGDVKAMLAAAKLPEKTVPVCLRGDLVAEHEEAERQLAEAEKLADVRDSLDGGGGIGELVEHLEALEAQMREHTLTFRLRAMPKPKFRALVAAHPPRKDDDGEVEEADRYLGVNSQTFFDALIEACVVAPELDADDWFRLIGPDGVLSDHQFDQLSTAAWGVNRHDVDVPFSRAASRLKRTSAPE
jgi:hypothetical protein